VQGHGELILRGEIDDAIRSNLRYLDALRKRVARTVGKVKAREMLEQITLESCGKSRIPLGGLVRRLHQGNVAALYESMSKNKK
jgi:hypothetical protein